jgi:hypothetical protein
MGDLSTREYVEKHKRNVSKRIQMFISLLQKRADNHDNSKLTEPEYSLWCAMDMEPRYRYGTPEYEDKLRRFRKVFELHYKNNRHHPEHHLNGVNDMNLIDLIEMLCDFISYKEEITYTEASNMLDKQADRFNFSEEIRTLLLNTLNDYYVNFGGLGTNSETVEKDYIRNNFYNVKVDMLKPSVDINV